MDQQYPKVRFWVVILGYFGKVLTYGQFGVSKPKLVFPKIVRQPSPIDLDQNCKVTRYNPWFWSLVKSRSLVFHRKKLEKTQENPLFS